MSASHTSLDTAASERKARLAKLASLKRKQPGSDTTVNAEQENKSGSRNDSESKIDVYVSGRNYDIVTKGPRLGFESQPSAQVDTVERQADRLAASAADRAAKDEVDAEKGIDLFKLQPKKPNWDLKRELAEKMKVVDVRTQNAIARLVRERIQNAKKEAQKTGKSTDEEHQGEEVGIEGAALVEGVHQREREEEEEREELQEEADSIP